eukprot:987070-Amphidinium_carterae.1
MKPPTEQEEMAYPKNCEALALGNLVIDRALTKASGGKILVLEQRTDHSYEVECPLLEFFWGCFWVWEIYRGEMISCVLCLWAATSQEKQTGLVGGTCTTMAGG